MNKFYKFGRDFPTNVTFINSTNMSITNAWGT